VTIPADTIDTDVKMRDDDLRSDHYFDVAKYPTITFASTAVSHKKGDRYEATGNLTIHGVTKQVTLPFEVYGPIKDPFGSPRFGLSTHIVVDRLDYGVGAADKLTGGQLAEGRDVDIHINLEAIPPAPAN
jgi:polyisoprenoid-binding protein YceI